MTAPLVAKAPCDVDVIARELARCAAMAVAMPPAWDGAKVAHGFTGTSGENLGRVLPGRGIALASDLKSLGITKPIPHVFEKSLAMRAVEACGGRERLAMGAAAILLSAKLGALGMADALGGLALAITNYDGIINARANGKFTDRSFVVSSGLTVSANAWFSFVGSTAVARVPAGPFTATEVPSGMAPNATDQGGLLFGLANPSGSDKKYLLTVGFTGTQTINVVVLVDILAASGGVLATVTTSQTTGHPALTRYTNGAGNLIVLEVTTQLGAGASNISATYTNQSGTTGRAINNNAGIGAPSNATAGRLFPFTLGLPGWALANGDYGVRAIETVRSSQNMGAGVFNAYVYRPIHFFPGVGANVYVERDSTVQIDGLTELALGSDSQLPFLGVFVLPATTNPGTMTGFLRMVDG